MLIATKQIHGCSIEGADGVLGKVDDLLFDRTSWTVRYLDVDIGGWLRDRHVILVPSMIQCADYAARRLGTPLTREQVENSPLLESHLPVTRKHEIEAAQYFAWEAYWANVNLEPSEIDANVDSNLLSAWAVSGYRIEAADGTLGHVDDFIIDDGELEGRLWETRHLVVDTRNWLPGKHVLVPPAWVKSVDWNTRRIHTEMACETIKNGPEYNPSTPVNRQYEEVFHDYYGRLTCSRQADPVVRL